MEENYYLFSDILFALRKEYLENQKRIKVLKNYIAYDAKKIEDFNFSLLTNKRALELIVDIEKRQNRLMKKINMLRKKFGVFIYPAYDTKIVKRDGKYDFYNQDLGLKIKRGQEDNFTRQIKKIKNSNFVKEMGSQYTSRVVNSLESALNITYNFINLYIQEGYLADVSCEYYAPKDEIVLVGSRRRLLNKDDLTRMLNTRCRKDSLSDYQRAIVDSEDMSSKAIDIVGEAENVVKARFAIDEDDIGYVLTKKKNN